VHAISDPSQVADPEYLPGLRRAVLAAIDHSILSIEAPEQQPSPIPVPLLSQARMAGRNEVSLDTVVRRCAVGHTLVVNFMEEEASRDGLQSVLLRDLRHSQVAFLERLLSALSDEHDQGSKERPMSPQASLSQRVRRLLAGELVDTSEISYNFDGYHVGIITTGSGAMDVVHRLMAAFDARLLSMDGDSSTVWAWFGTRDEVDRQRLGRVAMSACPSTTPLALGEPANGLTGWRQTHRQAKAAFSFTPQRPRLVTQYADVALLASMSKDELLTSSLQELYVDPLKTGPDEGLVLRKTLRAYFSSARNSSSAAALLGVTRQTVTNRLRIAELRIGRPLVTCAADLEAALNLEDEITG
jgi:hypothetical protein